MANKFCFWMIMKKRWMKMIIMKMKKAKGNKYALRGIKIVFENNWLFSNKIYNEDKGL